MSEEVAAVAAPAQSEPSAPQTGGIHQAYDHRIGESSSEGSEPKAGAQPNAETDVKAAKKPSAYYQIRQAKKAFKAQQEEFQRQREAFNRERQAAQEAAKPKRDYTVGELQKYRTEWEREGRYDLVDAADKEIAVMQAEADAERKARTVEYPQIGSQEHQAQWKAAERELAAADPEFQIGSGNRLDTLLCQIMAGPNGNDYRRHPQGIIAAYHWAKMELLKADMKSLQTELEKERQQNKKYQGLTSIGGGGGARVNSGGGIESLADFAKLSTKDMRKHLLASAKREGGSWF